MQKCLVILKILNFLIARLNLLNQKIFQVSIFISGRPLIVDEYIELSDAFIGGYRDLLFEEFNFNFKGN